MAMNVVKRVFICLASLLLAVPLAALARQPGSRAGAGNAASSHGKGLGMTQHQAWRSHAAVHQLIGHSQTETRAWVGTRHSFYSPYYSQNFAWPYAYNGYWMNPYYAPQETYSHFFPYLYFYDLYAQEAERSRQAADEFEVSLAREGKLTGPAAVGSFASDSRPLLPGNVALTLDEQFVAPPPSGGPLVIGSGHHVLRIAAKAVPPDN
jgi:hypothetical protein